MPKMLSALHDILQQDLLGDLVIEQLVKLIGGQILLRGQNYLHSQLILLHIRWIFNPQMIRIEHKLHISLEEHHVKRVLATAA